MPPLAVADAMPPRIAHSLRRVRAACIAAPLLTGCTPAVLDPRGPIAAANRTILLDSLAIMLAIVVPVIVATLAAAWWFRASNTRARYRPAFVFSGRVELVVWSIPLMTIVLLGGVAWLGSHALDPARPLTVAGGRPAEPLEIQVVSLDWKWLFVYPDQGVASVNELVVPAGRPLHFALTSASVMNTFFVPQLGSMIYTMNGMATELYLQADRPGTYRGLSGHYSGAGFSDMRFAVRALPAGEFDAWAAAAKRDGAVLDRDAYAALARPSSPVAPMRWGQVEPGLFAAVVDRRIAPGPGPSASDAPRSSPAAGAAASAPAAGAAASAPASGASASGAVAGPPAAGRGTTAGSAPR